MDSERRASRARTLALALILAALHVALTCFFVSPHALWAREPLEGEDYDLHAAQAYRVGESLARFGHSWVYDVSLLAGQPEGTILDAGAKGWELWTYGLSVCGVPPGRAFNLFVLAVMLAGPWVVYGAGRLLRFTPTVCLLAGMLCSLLWFFDSFLHWMWWVGMVSYGAASYLALVPLALYVRFVEAEQTRVRWIFPCGLALGLVLLVHPYAFFALVAPLGALTVRSARTFRGRDWLAVLGIVLCALAPNLYWLDNARTHAHYLLDSAYYAQGGASYLLSDFAGLLTSASDTGMIGTRTGFRVLVIALGLAGVWQLSRGHTRAALPLALALCVPLALAYLGVYMPFGGQTQPYRNVAPAMLAATLPAAHALVAALRSVRESSGAARAALVAVLLVALQHLIGDVLYFVPTLVPEAASGYDGAPSSLTKYGFLTPHPAFQTTHVHYGLPHALALEGALSDTVSWVERHVPQGSRILVEHPSLGERIARKTGVEVIGGFRERNLQHAYANYFRSYAERAPSHDELARYLETYAIAYVISQGERTELDEASDLLEPLAFEGGFRIHRTRRPVSPISRGQGRLHARTNRIAVEASDPRQELILAYHFHEALRCRPACRVERAPRGIDPVGLIRVPAPHPPSFTIENGYGAPLAK